MLPLTVCALSATVMTGRQCCRHVGTVTAACPYVLNASQDVRRCGSKPPPFFLPQTYDQFRFPEGAAAKV